MAPYERKAEREMRMQDVQKMCLDDGKAMVVVDGRVYDLTMWKHAHPGGETIINDFVGQGTFPLLTYTIHHTYPTIQRHTANTLTHAYTHTHTLTHTHTHTLTHTYNVSYSQPPQFQRYSAI